MNRLCNARAPGFQFNDSNYDNSNSNSAGSSHPKLFNCITDPASWQKMIIKYGVLVTLVKAPWKKQRMKRINNLFEKICSIENLELADIIARKGKSGQYGIKVHDKNRSNNILQLHELLITGKFRTSNYTTFKVYEPKEREVYRLPYYPDRIVHHAIMNILEPIFVSTFTSDTYSCIKTRGIHAAARNVKKALANKIESEYCLKFDIRKFYPSIDHDVLKQLLRRKFKDKKLLQLLDEIIDSAPGLPIGNYLSQYFANFYLSGLDHWVKEEKQVLHYFRYADDIVIFSSQKEPLHTLRKEIEVYLSNLKLEMKSNHQVFPIKARGLDFVGYRFYHTHTLLRKTIKKKFARAVARRCNSRVLASYNGWAKHCDSRKLLKKLFHEKV
jgi:RNA-directed DNA polymerase